MTNQTSHWMTIREAALALGVSELTVRRRIKDGRLTHRLVNGKYYIDLETSPASFDAPEQMDGKGTGWARQPFVDAPEHMHRSRPAGSRPERPGPEAKGPDAFSLEGDDIGSRDAPSSPPLDLDRLLAEHRSLAEMAGRARLLEDQLTDLAAKHEELRAGMLSLAGRNGWLESKLEERESELKLLTDERPRAPWWKRWLQG